MVIFDQSNQTPYLSSQNQIAPKVIIIIKRLLALLIINKIHLKRFQFIFAKGTRMLIFIASLKFPYPNQNSPSNGSLIFFKKQLLINNNMIIRNYTSLNSFSTLLGNKRGFPWRE